MDVDKALATQIENIQKKTGKTLDQLDTIRKQSERLLGVARQQVMTEVKK